MDEAAFDRLTPAKRRRLVLHLVCRVTATIVSLVTLYYVLPADGDLDSAAVALLVAGLVILAGIITWQVRAIVRSDYPGLRAIEAMVFTVTLYLLAFAAVYFMMGRAFPATFTQTLTRTDALYFTVTVFATVGFGDIAARTEVARLVVTVQMIGNLVLLGLGLKVFLGAAKLGRERRSAARHE